MPAKNPRINTVIESLRILTIFLLISCCTTLASSNPIPEYQATEVIAAIEANYSRIQTLSGRMSQIRQYGNNKIQSELAFFFKSPDKLYLDYLTPLRQIIIANGTSCWVYSPENKQAEKIDLTGANNETLSPVKLLGIDILDELKRAFDLTITEKEADKIVILASPKAKAVLISQILITVDPSRWVISSLKLMNKKGDLISQTGFEDYRQINNIWFPLRIKARSLLEKKVIIEDVSFHRLKLNPDIPDERFDFVSPEGADVIAQ